MWIVEGEHEADIASDLSAFHRIDDVAEIDGPRYFSLAQRLSAYSGVIGAIVAKRQADEDRATDGGQSAPRGRVERVSEASTLAALSDGWVEHVKSGE